MGSFQHEEDYYAIFNIPRNANQEEITRAFRRLSLFSHPDRFKTIEEKSAARIYFEKYQRIYEVLSDPEKRLIYDSVGEKGLQIEGWEIIPRQKGVAEIRAEARRIVRLHELEILDKLSRPKGSFNLFIDATQNLSTFEVKGISCSQSVMFPWTTNSNFFASAVVNSMNGVGSGKFSGGFRSRTFDTISWEMIVEYADEMSCRMKSLSENVTGIISAKAGTQCSVTTTLNYSVGQFNMAVASTVGVPASMLAATCVFSSANKSNFVGTTMKYPFNKFMKPSYDDDVKYSANQAKHEEHEALTWIFSRPNDINVTVPLQLLVRNSKLIIQKDVDKITGYHKRMI
ncbi:DnaJ -like protein subfamily C member 11 [Trichinella britovi]|uniref:DnaJ-like protein subfamily C member 11 n=1 Tax=Trichinella britovi TaxID=45882 RepID=A0A0V1CTM0_TRIBR|nr:DnaJ -like protein subfamily C member 11 [Trichinella britovi]